MPEKTRQQAVFELREFLLKKHPKEKDFPQSALNIFGKETVEKAIDAWNEERTRIDRVLDKLATEALYKALDMEVPDA